MATSQGDIISYEDLKNWYTTFNTLASKYGTGTTRNQMAIPDSDSTAIPSHINTLHAKITQFHSDKFLKTKSAWWPTGVNVSTGNLILATNIISILGVISNAPKVKCRNTATNNKGKHNSTCSNGTNSKCTSSVRTDGNGNTSYSRSVYRQGTCQSGTQSNGYKSNTTTIDITQSQSKKTN